MDTELTDYRQSEASDEQEAGKISKIKTFEVGIDQDGERLDKVLAANLPEVSRSRLKTLIEEGFLGLCTGGADTESGGSCVQSGSDGP